MPFPEIDPVLLSIGPIAIRWYGLAFLVGILSGVMLARRYARRYPVFGLSARTFEDYGLWVTAGVIVGGRLGSVLLYNLEYYVQRPLEIFMLNQGGMSFHGGLAGVVLATVLCAWKNKISMLALGDIAACAAPIGIFLVRVANFINGELWGRVTEAPWGVIFPGAGPEARHPSQLYEAALEGALLFVVLNLLIRNTWVRARAGLLSGLFLVGYGVIRFLIEYTREPDADLILGLTRGQFYSLPMLVLGLVFVWRSLSGASRRPLGSARQDEGDGARQAV